MSAKLRLHAAPATFISLAVILALVGVALVAFSGAAAGPGQPKCGERITTDTTLHKDLVNCPNNGIIVGADNVTLDLNGHLIDGDGETPAAGCHPRKGEFCDVGVLNRGHDGVTVMHGSVREFNVGPWGLRISHNRLLGVSSSSNQCCGLGFFRGTRSLIRTSSGSGSEDANGMFLIASHHVRVQDNSFRDNGDQGIFVSESTHNLSRGTCSSATSSESSWRRPTAIR
jgi:parallel beta-helix repeat protein